MFGVSSESLYETELHPRRKRMTTAGKLVKEIRCRDAQIEALQSRVAELEKALKNYGAHQLHCNFYKHKPFITDDCNCGFAAMNKEGK